MELGSPDKKKFILYVRCTKEIKEWWSLQHEKSDFRDETFAEFFDAATRALIKSTKTGKPRAGKKK